MKKLTIWLLVLGLAATACSGVVPDAEVAPQPTPTIVPTPTSSRGVGGKLTILHWQAPTILNPHLANASKDWDASRVAYEPLASFNEAGELIPFLAAEIPSLDNGGVALDGRSVTWKLKRGVRWSDGEPFSAADVLFTYQFITNAETGATTGEVYNGVDSVEVIDDYTVKVNFKDVTPGWFLPFVGIQGMIIPRHIFEPYNGPNAREAPANRAPVGTGPYQVVSFKPQEVLFLGTELIETNKIVYEPNPFFREEDKPYFRRIELRGGGTVKEAARSVLQVGDVDFAVNLQLDIETLTQMEAEGDKGHLIYPFISFVERILLNRTDPDRATPDGERSSIQFPHPILSDKKVREALTFAIDREKIAALYGPAARPTSNILVSPLNYQSPHTSYEFNLDKAAALLDEAGWVDTNGDGIRDKNGQKLSLVFQTSANSVRQETQRIVQQDLASIGVEIEVKIIDSSVFFSSDPNNPNTRFHFYADLEMFNIGNFNPDPGIYMKSWTCDEMAQKSNNWASENIERWCNPEYDALYQQSTVELDPDRREQLFIQMNDMLIEDVVAIPLAHRARTNGMSNTLEGVELTPWDATLWNIKDWRRKEQ
ncbi:MAG: peptide ABC transporter substrate-binding protein [Chloroflexota bacterium]